MILTKRITAFIVSALMLVTMVASTAVTVSAISGAGLPSSETANVAHGIDISKWNFGTDYDMIDFARAKADGCDFVILRIGTGYGGDNNLDVSFIQHYKNARAAGMPMGLYFYSYGTTAAEAKEDAEWVMSVIEENDMYFEYPLYYDTEEEDQEALSDAKYVEFCLGWCDTLAEAGYYPGVYGTAGALDKLSDSFNATYDRWYARVKTGSATGSTSGQYNTTDRNYSTYASMWQYAWFDYIYDGITLSSSDSGLDVDVAYKDYPAIMEKYGYNNVPTSALDDAIEAAEAADYTLYTAEQIDKIRSVYAEAKTVASSDTATTAQRSDMADKLIAALEDIASKNESVVSAGKSYTATSGSRLDGKSDDGVRLTDGAKGVASATSGSGYSAWTDEASVDIVIDLGYSQYSNIFRVYGVGGADDVNAPSTFSVAYSADGSDFTYIGTTQRRTEMSASGSWISYCYTYTAEEAVNARYIKFSVMPNGTQTWIDEIEAVYDPTPALTGRVAVTGINGYILPGYTYVYTPDFGTVTVAKANHAYTRNIVAKWSDEDNAYVVTSNTVGSGTSTTPDVTLADGEIMIAAHNWESGITDSSRVPGSELNVQNLALASVGSLITLNGIDVDNLTTDIIPYITVTQKSEVADPDDSSDIPEDSSEPDESSEPDPGESSEPDPGESSEPDPVEPEYVYGDADGDGTVDSKDYTLVKRHVLGTYEIAEPYRGYCDLDSVEGISASDYTLVKRIVLKTYTHNV